MAELFDALDSDLIRGLTRAITNHNVDDESNEIFDADADVDGHEQP